MARETRRWVLAGRRLVQIALTVLLAGSALAGPAGAAPAGTVVGNGTPASCTESAFDAAVAVGGDITFSCGGPKTIALTQPATIADIPTTIDGGNAITLTGNLTTTLLVGLTGSRLLLSHIVLDQGYNQFGDGGAIDNVEDLALDDVLIQFSSAGEFGGAIYTTGRLDIRNSRLMSNQALSGGAIYALGSVEMTIADSSLQFNEATDTPNGDGGAIYLGPASQLTVAGGNLGKNGAHGFGGALYLAPGAQATIGPSGATAAEVDFNSGYNGGGGIYNDGGTLALSNTRVEANQTLTGTIGVGFGGGIADLGALVVEGGTIANNGSRFGGGVFVGDGAALTATAAITHASLFSNRAAVYGGGLYTNVNSTTVSLENDFFGGNQATSGGGLARTNAQLSVSKSSFSGNRAQDGGGLFVQGVPNPGDATYVEVRDTTISGNDTSVQHSGGIENSALLDLRNVTIIDNHYGLWDENGAEGTIARLQSTVLDNPTFFNCDGDGSVAPTSGGHNLATDNSCNLSAGNLDQSNTNAKLGGPTSDPDVFTLFYPPLAGSPLINNGGPGCSPTDQRYALRPDACDIGAIEFGGLVPRIFVPLLRK